MRGRMIDEHVRSLVENLDAFSAYGMKALMGVVSAVGDPLSGGMPIGIDHRAFQRVVLGLEYLNLSLLGDERAPVVATDVESEPVG